MHNAVQKYKTKTYEKVLTEKVEGLTRDMQGFQETVRSKILEITAIVE